ncbi:MAG: hypothetical protein R6X02_09090 [Enhygromyxa sp.]
MLEAFAATDPPTQVTVDGKGVHWHCTASRGNRSAYVSCFASMGVEYAASYDEESSRVAHGRTSSPDRAIAVVADWLGGATLERLYERYDFVDRRKRQLSAILAHVVEKTPAVAELPQAGLVSEFSEFFTLQFGDEVRGCRLSYYGDNELPDAVFSWDRCALFSYQPDDLDILARLVSRWICDAAMPSAIREEYPWLEIGDVADAYEQGRGVEGEFIDSWDHMQDFFADLPLGLIPRIAPFLAAMRSHGFDRTLRAGQSMATLILSRARRHGLGPGAPHLAFNFYDAGVTAELSGVGNGRQVSNATLELNDDILELLRALEAEPIR